MSLQFEDNFAEIERKLLRACENAVDETTHAVAKDAKKGAAVDFGAMREIIHVVSQDKSEYADAKARALVQNPKLGKQIASEYPLQNIERGVIHGAVDVPLDYAPLVELGTGRTRPQPFLGPAGDKQRGKLGERAAAELKRELE